jgi:hypothetical protein
MKVYELMTALSNMEAGTDVQIRLLRTLSEMSLFDDNDGEPLYEISVDLNNIDTTSSGTILVSD